MGQVELQARDELCPTGKLPVFKIQSGRPIERVPAAAHVLVSVVIPPADHRVAPAILLDDPLAVWTPLAVEAHVVAVRLLLVEGREQRGERFGVRRLDVGRLATATVVAATRRGREEVEPLLR